jgi:hypothetical protein
MDNWIGPIVGTHAAAPGRIDPGHAAALAREAGEEWLRMGTPRVNVLVAGRDEAVQLVLETLFVHIEKPIANWSPGEPLMLPPVGRPGTLVLHDVAALEPGDQIRLLQWSARAMGSMQVISTTSAPLLPRIAAGTFIDTLYYRLNTVYIELERPHDDN